MVIPKTADVRSNSREAVRAKAFGLPIFKINVESKRWIVKTLIDSGGMFIMPISDVYILFGLNTKLRDMKMMPTKMRVTTIAIRNAMRRARLKDVIVKLTNRISKQQTHLIFKSPRRYIIYTIGDD